MVLYPRLRRRRCLRLLPAVTLQLTHAQRVKNDIQNRQVHVKDRQVVAMTSRRGLDHSDQRKYDVLAPVVLKQVCTEALCVWVGTGWSASLTAASQGVA